MNNSYQPGPFDEFRGIFEFDCMDYISPELKAQLQDGEFLPVQPPPDGCDLVVRPDSSDSDADSSPRS